MSLISLIALLSVGQVSAPAEGVSTHRLDVGAAFVYGFGDGHAFGGLIEGTYGLPVWETSSLSGTLDAGVLVGYQAEPYSFINPQLGGAVASGTCQRVQGFVVVGHRVRLPPSQRLLVGLQLFGGWTHVFAKSQLTNSTYDLSVEHDASDGAFTTGVTVEIGFRVLDNLTVMAKVMGPLPIAPASITSYVMPTLGASIRLP